MNLYSIKVRKFLLVRQKKEASHVEISCSVYVSYRV